MYECYVGDVVLRLVEDGYVTEEGEVGLLRECGQPSEVVEFEDGKVYIYRFEACGSGVFRRSSPSVYHWADYLATPVVGTLLLAVVSKIQTSESSQQP